MSDYGLLGKPIDFQKNTVDFLKNLVDFLKNIVDFLKNIVGFPAFPFTPFLLLRKHSFFQPYDLFPR